tara:strand:- start:320 stop:1066 length:747 start_codon:yes stop_codon:yes gene_type:complete
MFQEKIKASITICIPVYNEEKYISTVIRNIRNYINSSKISQQYIIKTLIIDDGSTDNSLKEIQNCCQDLKNFKFVSKQNEGKGSAIIKSIEIADTDYILIHDSDLEYITLDIDKILEFLLTQNTKTIIFGSRYKKNNFFNSIFFNKNNNQSFLNYYFNAILSLIYLFKFSVKVTDSLTAFKLYPLNEISGLKFKSKKFSTEHEITGFLLRKNINFFEVPISYYPRTVEEGKKISYKDGLEALIRVLKL